MSNFDWSKPQRQEPIGLLFFAVASIRKLFKVFLAILAPLLFKIAKNEEVSSKKGLITFGLLGAITLFVLIVSALNYWYYRFQIVNGEFVVNKGFFAKTKLSISLDRIQTVNVKQNLIQQVFNIVTVVIDSAGAIKEEVKLTAVKGNVAKAIQDAVKKHEVLTEVDTETLVEEKEKNTTSTNDQKLILKLSAFDIAKVGLTQNHLKSLLLIFGVIFYIYNQVLQVSKDVAKEYSEKGIDILQHLGEGILFWSFIVVLVLFFAVVISFMISFIAFFNFKLQQQKDTFKVSFGLLNYKEVSVPNSKIQMLVVNENPLRNLLKFKSVEFKQTTSGNKVKKKQRIVVPACKAQQQKELLQTVFETENFTYSDEVKTHPIYFIRNFIFSVLVLVLPLSIIGWGEDGFFEFILMVVAISGVYNFLAYFRRGFRLNENIIAVTKGSIEKDTVLQHNYKLQAVKYSQSILMKRSKLASLMLYSAAGPNIKIPYIPEDIALQTQNFLLYKIESSNKAWM